MDFQCTKCFAASNVSDEFDTRAAHGRLDFRARIDAERFTLAPIYSESSDFFGVTPSETRGWVCAAAGFLGQ